MAKDKVSANEIADLVDRVGPALVAFAGMSSTNPEDIVQEAFCRLVREKSTIEKPESWLFTVVRNLVPAKNGWKTIWFGPVVNFQVSIHPLLTTNNDLMR